MDIEFSYPADMPDKERVIECVSQLEREDGSFGNEPGAMVGTTPASAAAITLLRHVGGKVKQTTVEWLLDRCFARGGFSTLAELAMPDMLSTATALQALAGAGANLTPIREKCINFIESLWSGRGGFYAHWGDQDIDVEYTCYGLLALGALAEEQ